GVLGAGIDLDMAAGAGRRGHRGRGGSRLDLADLDPPHDLRALGVIDAGRHLRFAGRRHLALAHELGGKYAPDLVVPVAGHLAAQLPRRVGLDSCRRRRRLTGFGHGGNRRLVLDAQPYPVGPALVATPDVDDAVLVLEVDVAQLGLRAVDDDDLPLGALGLAL